MTDAELTRELAERVMGWKATPGVHGEAGMWYLDDETGLVVKLSTEWSPLHSHDDAFELLEAWVGNDQRKNYCVWKFWHTQNEQWVYEITLYTKHREESLVVNKSAPRAICLAVAQTVGIKVDI